MREVAGWVFAGGLAIFAALPATNNYKLHDYGFGAGGGTTGTSNYSLEGLAGELSGQMTSSDNYGLKSGLLGSRLANLPGAPTWQNPADWYNKLQLIIDTSGNPDDTTYAVAISDDDFATTSYVQSDDTVGSALGPEDFRDYSAWGGVGGMSVIGLKPDTSYKVKVKARQGGTSETGFGPEATASTSDVSIIFDIDIDDTDAETSEPYNLEFGSVMPGTVADSPNQIWLDIDSNAESGVFVYVVSNNSGLVSSAANYTITSVTGDLDVLSEGIGAQNLSVSESSGGPLAPVSPYDGASDNVGTVDNQYRQILTSTGPLSDGRASFLLKLKTNSTTPAAIDYLDIYTLVATAAF